MFEAWQGKFFKLTHRTRREGVGVAASRAHFEAPGHPGAHYQRTTQPDAGAMAFAYETLGLAPYPPSGPTIATRSPIEPTAKPLYSLQALPLIGLPTVAGQLIGQPLFNPFGDGYSGQGPVSVALAPNVVDPTRLEYHTM